MHKPRCQRSALQRHLLRQVSPLPCAVLGCPACSLAISELCGGGWRGSHMCVAVLRWVICLPTSLAHAQAWQLTLSSSSLARHSPGHPGLPTPSPHAYLSLPRAPANLHSHLLHPTQACTPPLLPTLHPALRPPPSTLPPCRCLRLYEYLFSYGPDHPHRADLEAFSKGWCPHCMGICVRRRCLGEPLERPPPPAFAWDQRVVLALHTVNRCLWYVEDIMGQAAAEAARAGLALEQVPVAPIGHQGAGE